MLVMDSNVKRMDENTANEEERKEWGRYCMEATLIGARSEKREHNWLHHKRKANADARPQQSGSRALSVLSPSG